MVTEHAVPPVPQLRPAPLTVPPVGLGLIAIVYGGPLTTLAVNEAVHVLAPSTDTVVVGPVPEHEPPQLANA
jgi:hypothetical protein